MLVVPEITIVPEMVEKLTRLYTLLKQGKQSYEKIALKLRDKQLRQTIIGLAQECNQYASEVFAQIYCLGGSSDYPVEHPVDKEETEEEKTDEENISDACNISENTVLPYYKELQNEHLFLIDELRQMIKYQMEGFLYYSEQLKLLKTSII